jgi:hypothetical protein
MSNRRPSHTNDGCDDLRRASTGRPGAVDKRFRNAAINGRKPTLWVMSDRFAMIAQRPLSSRERPDHFRSIPGR